MFRKLLTVIFLLSLKVAIYGQISNDISRIFSKSVSSNIRADEFVSDPVFLDLNVDFLKECYQKENQRINITIPVSDKENITLDLERFQVLNENFILRTASGDTINDYKPGIIYKGKIAGKGGFATLCIFNDEIGGIVSIDGLGNYNIGKLSDTENQYIIYNDLNIKTPKKFICQTLNNNVENRIENNLIQVREDRCVSFYLEGDYELFQSKGGINQTVNYIITLFAEIAVLYSNENISIGISEINVWTTPDNYSNKAGADLDRLKTNNLNFNGDLASLLSHGGSGEGGLAWVDVLCSSSNPYSFCGIDGSFNNVPTYSWDVMVCAHEWGHNFGSPHTHDCSWNGNNTQIDDCGNLAGESPACYNPANPKIPQNGGTIMSYCHLNSVGINLTLGFGPQPGNLIRNRYNSATCLTACQGLGAPRAEFETNSNVICEDETVIFNDLSTFSPKTWQWSFPGGDPATSTEKNPKISYYDPGVFEVTLKCSNILGSDSLTKTGYITVNGKDNPLFTYTISSYKKVQFDNKSKFASSYFWDFGDGAYSFDSLPDHTYQNDGLYSVTLYTYNDNCPSDDVYSTDINIVSPPVANFTFNQTDFCKPSSIQFFDASSYNTTSRLWEFEGGTPASSTDLNPQIVYYEADSFKVKLTVSNSLYSNSKELNNVVIVSTTPIVNFLYSINADKVIFTNNTQNGENYEWDFGDGNFSNEKNPVHTYSHSGTYTVKLIATNNCGNETKEKTVVFNKVRTSDLIFNKFNLFPNPNNGEFSMEMETPENGNYEFKIYNSTGMQIYNAKKFISTGFNNIDFYLKDIPEGLYLLRISKDSKILSTLFVIN